MRNLLWKEWREHRLIFFLSLAIVVITRILLSLFLSTPAGKDFFETIPEDIITLPHMLLSLIFTLFLGATPFTNEFSNRTHIFLLCHPIARARIYWTKFFFGLVLLTLLVLSTTIAFFPLGFNYLFNIPFNIYDKSLIFIILVIYSATFFTSLLFRDFLVTVVATPFIIIGGLVLILMPFLLVVLCLWESKQLFELPVPYILSIILFLLLILFGFLCWQKAISKSKNVYKTISRIVSTVITIQLLTAIGFLVILIILLIIYKPLAPILEFTTITLSFILSLLFILMGFLISKKMFTNERYPAKMLTLILTSAVSLFLATYTIANVIANRELKNAIMTAQKTGLPVTLKEIIPPSVPDSENGALLYEECFSIYEKLKKKYSKEWNDISFERKFDIKELSQNKKRRLTELVFNDTDFIRMYDLLKKAVEMPYCRFNLKYEDGFLMGLPHLGKMRNIANMVAIKTILLAKQGKYEEALEFVRIGLRLSLALENEPIYMSQLFRIYYDYFAMKGLIEIFSDIPLDAIPVDVYRRLIDEIELRKTDTGLRKALEGETAIHVDIFGKILHGKVRLNEIFSDDFPGDDLLAKIFWKFYTGYLGKPLINKDTAFYLNSMVKITDIFLKPYYEVKDKMEELKMELGEEGFTTLRKSILRWRHPLSSEVLPWAIDNQKEWVENTAKLNGLKIALALKIYKAEKEEYPNSLDVLIPKYLLELPKDPFIGKNYIYHKEDEGFVVYSVGKNEKDNDGVYDKKSPSLNDDLTWRSLK